MKKIVKVIIAIVVIALICGGAFLYHTKTLNQALADQKQAQEQKELLESRVADIKSKLDSAEQEKETLASKIDALLTEDVYFFDAAMIMEEIQEIGELATMEYCYTNVGTLDASKKLFKTEVDIPLTKKTVVMTMDGVLKVGVDVNDIKIDCDEATKTITIKLPKVQMFSDELDENSIRIYDEKGGMFNKVTMEDSSALRSQIKERAEQNAIANGVYDQARTNAETILRCMLEAIPHLKDTYSIEFK